MTTLYLKYMRLTVCPFLCQIPSFLYIVTANMEAFVIRSTASFGSNNSTQNSTQNSIDLSDDDDGSDLTSAVSGETPTLPDSGEAPSIRALQTAADDAAYDLALARIPSEHRVKIGVHYYVKYDTYRPKRSKKLAWYWHSSIAEELFCTTKENRVSGTQRRNSLFWRCKIEGCKELQFSRANSENKEGHLKRAHGITRHGKKTPTMPVDKDAIKVVSVRAEKEGYTNLVSVVSLKPLKEALIAWLVICQLSLSLAVNDLFIEFLEVLYPSVRTLLPLASNTIRSWIMASFVLRKSRMKETLHKAPSLIHFSFDLWTSPNHLALMGVVAHFIDESGKNQSVSESLLAVHVKRPRLSSSTTTQLLYQFNKKNYI